MDKRLLASATIALGLMTGLALAAPPVRAPIGEFTLVKLAQPPTLDGQVAPGEWDGAFTTSGLMAAFEQQLMTTDTTMAVGWHGDEFYFLFRCRRSPNEWRLTKGVRFNDDYDFGDPSVEVWISPPTRVPETYQSILNTYPAVLDNHQIPSRGYTAAGWRGNWRIGVTEDADGYTLEAAIPASDFGMAGLADGDIWRLLLARTAQGAQPRAQGSWSLTQGFNEIPQHPPVTLREDDVAVQLTNIHTLLAGNYEMPLVLVAPRRRDATVEVEIRWQPGSQPDDQADLIERQTIKLAAGNRELIELKGKVPDQFAAEISEQQMIDGKRQTVKVTRPKGVFSLAVRHVDGKTLFRQSFPYVASGWTWTPPVRPATAPPVKPLAARIMYGPETHTLVLRADILDLPERDQVAAARVRVLDPAAGDRELKSAELPAFRESYSELFMSLEGIEAPLWEHDRQDAEAAAVKAAALHNQDGRTNAEEARKRYLQERKRYEDRLKANPDRAGEPPVEPPAFAPLPVPPLPTGPAPRPLVVEVSALDANQQPLASDRQEIKLLRRRFSWQGNDAGHSDQVIPPWTPVQAGTDGFAVWNRQLGLDGLGCATTIANGGVQQIRSMRLVAVVDGRDVPIQAGQPQLGKSTEAYAEFTGEGQGAGLRLTASHRLEFDGFLTTELTIAPLDLEAGAKIDQLYWEVVMPEAEATHYCTTAGGWAAVHDETPAYWGSPQSSTGMMIGDFVPYIWLTNSDRAFMWFADNDQGWITEAERAVATQEIVRADGQVTLRVRFVELPTHLRQPTTLRHGWMTFPSRPLPPGARSVIVANSKADYPSARFTHFWFDGDWAVLWPYYCSPFPWSMQRSKGHFDASFARSGSSHRPMVGSIAHSIGRYQDYEGRQFGDLAVDWGEMPGQIGNSDVTQSQGPIDFRLWHYRRWVREAGFKGLYIDENYLSFDRNPLTGGAYLKPDGRVQVGYTYIGLREYFKRMMIMFHQEGVARPNLWQHISSGAAYHAWLGDIFMEGENVEPTDEEFDYLEVLPAGRLRSIASPATTGGTTIVMCQAQRHATQWADKHVHQFVGWVMAHDALPEGVRWYGPLAQAGRLHADQVDFVGYWKAESPVATATADCLVSMHRTADRALLWVVNRARDDRQVEVAVDWKKLGLDRAKTVAIDAESGAAVALTAGGFAIPVLKRDFAAVLLVERRALAAGQSFVATFDHGSAEADQALGCEMLVGDGRLVDGDRGQALAPGERGVDLWSHLNLVDHTGRLTFRAKLAEDRPGAILTTTCTAQRGDPRPLAPGILIEIRKDKEGRQLVFRQHDRIAKAPLPSVAVPCELAAGWHDFALDWQDGKLRLAIDGNPVGELPVESLEIPAATGPGLLRMAKFTFGGKGPVEAIDDLVAWRPTP